MTADAVVTAPPVGYVFEPLRVARVSRTTLALFAGASGDHNPIHIDTDVAASAGLADVFAHGMLSMAFLGRAVTTWFPQAQLRGFGVRFVAITPVHAVPTCHGTVSAVDGHTATLELAVRLADGTTTLTGSATVDLCPTVPRSSA